MGPGEAVVRPAGEGMEWLTNSNFLIDRIGDKPVTANGVPGLMKLTIVAIDDAQRYSAPTEQVVRHENWSCSRWPEVRGEHQR